MPTLKLGDHMQNKSCIYILSFILSIIVYPSSAIADDLSSDSILVQDNTAFAIDLFQNLSEGRERTICFFHLTVYRQR